MDSLEAYAERYGDPAPEVYRRLFARHPETEALFALDKDGGVRGSMLQQAFDCLIDLSEGEGRVAATIIHAERQNHAFYQVPESIFMGFFEAIRDTLQEGLGEDWTSQNTAAWTEALQKAQGLARLA
jgi:hemoglobin-like flavoprotein